MRRTMSNLAAPGTSAMSRSVVSRYTTRLATLALALGLGISAFHATPVAAQNPADTVPTFNLDSVIVTVLGTPIRFGASPFPVSVVGETELRSGKSGMFLDEALLALP